MSCCERSARRRLQDVLFIVVVLADYTNPVQNQMRRREPNAELSNHGDVTSSSHGIHESLGTRVGDSPKIVHELVLCHPNDRSSIGLVRNDLDEEIRLGLDLFWICDRLVPDLVESIGRIRNQLAQTEFLTGVERVDDQGHQLLNVGIRLRHGSRKLGNMIVCDDNKTCT